MKRILPLIVAAALIFCGCAAPARKSHEKLSIVTTIFPIYDFVRAVAGDKADVKLLIDPGTEVHSYDPSPSDVMAITDSDLFVFIGGESDTWTESILADSNVRTLKLMDSITPLLEDGEDEYDEHIWTSPENAVLMTEYIRDELSVLDTDNSDVYKNNSKDYVGKIKNADAKIREVVSATKDPYIVVADRFPFKYFVTYYGIKYSAAFGGCASSTDISLKVMTRLVNDVKKHNVKSVFCVEMSNRSIANALSEETKTQVIELHSAHSVTKSDFERGITYSEIMENNAEALKKGLE